MPPIFPGLFPNLPPGGILKVYEGKDIRNLVVIGHSHAGKNLSGIRAAFHRRGHPLLGRVGDSSTATDYDEEEISRQMTISTAIAPVEWHNTKIKSVRRARLPHVRP